MRDVGIDALKALLAAGMFMCCAALAQSAIAADQPAAATEVAATAEPAKEDYYTRRAKSIIDAEKSAALAPHPLAAAHPEMDVVVCEAGCPTGAGAQIVFARPHVVSAEGREGSMQTTSGDAAAASDNDPACVAGCYGRTASLAADLKKDEPQAAAEKGVWETSVAPPAAVSVLPITPARDKLSPVR